MSNDTILAGKGVNRSIGAKSAEEQDYETEERMAIQAEANGDAWK